MSNLMNQDFKIAIYIRLSKEDDHKKREAESESIANQRSLLRTYLKEHNFTVTSEYVDDGYSGTTFDRPSFNRLIQDIETGKINMVVTKDLSRLGRDYIQSGYYLEQYFPMKKVRYISVLDNIDTFKETTNNDIAPFKSLFNDMQSKDNSKKIRAILRDRKQQGYFLGSEPSFGYKKSPLDKHKLIIDEKTAPIVKKIFKLALQGKSNSEIAMILNEEKIITPTLYKNKKVSVKNQRPELWTPSSVYQILTKKIYTGTMVQGVQAKLDYKSKKRIVLEKDQWIEVKDTHPAIITEKEFNIVNKKSQRSKLKTSREKLLLEGLVYCKECKCLLGVKKDYRNKKRNHYVMNCNRYSRNSKLKLCSSHFLVYKELEDQVLKHLNQYLKKLNSNKISTLIEKTYKNKRKQTKKQELTILEQEKQKIETSLTKLYQDKEEKIISTTSYLLLAKEEEIKLQQLEKKITEYYQKEDYLQNNIWKDDNSVDIFKRIINRNLFLQLIDKITVSKTKEINIYYKFSKPKDISKAN